nr:immunoglobulin heavy chain junction region [Macaca mulatta]
CARHQSVFDYW